MFGLILSTRPVLVTTSSLPNSPNQYAFSVPPAPAFSHIVLFLLPGNTLPPDSAAAIYIKIPPAQDFKLLGSLTADKHSAIFKVNAGGAAAAGSRGEIREEVMLDDATLQPVGDGAGAGAEIVLGISIEPVAQVQAQLASQQTAARPTFGAATGTEMVRRQAVSAGSGQVVGALDSATVKRLAQRIIGNAYEFLSSFATAQETVPLSKFNEWWGKFEKKVDLDPGFLTRNGQG